MKVLTRDQSLDAFRGLTVILMVIVNIQGSGDNAFALIKHAEWNGLTFADLVFPWFLLIVGLSLPLSLDRGLASSRGPLVMRRAVMLFLWGMFLSWLIRPTLDPDLIRWSGVLQRIGIVYLACALVILFRPGYRVAALIAVAILIGHSAAILTLTAPGEAAPSLQAGEGISGWLDRALLPGRILRKSWDPEGILSTFPAIASGLIGVATMRWMRQQQVSVEAPLFAVAAVFVVLGYAFAAMVPINKGLWTASFVLVTSGFGIALWMGLRLMWRVVGGYALSRWFVLLGQTALTLYVIHMVLLAIIVRKLPSGARIWETLYDPLVGIGLSPALASLVFSLIAGAIVTAPLGALKRRGWLIKA